MNSFFLGFQDKILETKYQRDLQFAKLLNFHYFLIIELILIIIVTLFNVIYKEYTIYRIINMIAFLLFIIFIIFLSKKLKNWKYLLHIQIFIHFAIIILVIESTKMSYTEPELTTIFQIYGIPIHLCFVCIVLTKIHWVWTSIFNFIFHLFYIFRVYSIECLNNYPVIFILHFLCFLCFGLMGFYQEMTTRKFYELIFNSNQRIRHFENLLKNVIPSPILILDFDNKLIRFFNNSACDFMKKHEKIDNDLNLSHLNESCLFNDLSPFLQSKNMNCFKYVEKMLQKFKLLDDLDSENNSNCLLNRLLDKYNEIDKSPYNYLEHNETLTFNNVNLYLEDIIASENLMNSENKSRKYFNIKYLKMIWQSNKTILLIINDITELHKLEELKHLDEYKNRLLATVSHDLRTPVNGIIGMIELVLPKIKEKKERKNLTIAYRSGQLLLNMINDILDFSQINNKKLRLIFEHINLIEILKESSKLVKFGIKSKKLKFINYFPKNTECRVYSDSTRIRQILLNLLTNALKFTQNGSITLKLEEIIINSKNYYKISVEDTGIGIRMEDQCKLFKLFGKLDYQNKELNKTGVGLGLTISKNLAQMLNENDSEGIYLESKLGEGSIFWFYLPAKQNIDDISIADENKEISYLHNNQPQILTNSLIQIKKKVLLVDDDLINLMVGAKYCEFYGLDYITANDGVEAVYIIEKIVCKENCSIDGIFMDYNMPIMDGFKASEEIYKLLKENNKFIIPIIILTAGICKNVEYLKKESAIKSCIMKPVSKKQFVDVIGKYFQIKVTN